MVGQTNTVLCYFGKLPCCVKSKLLYKPVGEMVSSLYGLVNVVARSAGKRSSPTPPSPVFILETSVSSHGDGER